MPGTRLLVVDDDPRVRNLVVSTLEHHGYDVESATNGQEALECVNRRMPDLVVSDVMMPKMDGWSFIRRFRAIPDAALVPVVFMTSLDTEEHRMYGFKLGADEYITKPLKYKELIRRIQSALDRKRTFQGGLGGQTPEPIALSPGIRGTLDQMGIASLLTILEMERRTGRLVVRRSSSKQTSVIYVREGSIVRVVLKHHPDLKGVEAAYELLTWGDGAFEFRPMPVEDEDEVQANAASILLEAARRLDEENSAEEPI